MYKKKAFLTEQRVFLYKSLIINLSKNYANLRFFCLFVCLFLFSFFGCPHRMQNLLGQGRKPHHSSKLNHSSDRQHWILNWLSHQRTPWISILNSYVVCYIYLPPSRSNDNQFVSEMVHTDGFLPRTIPPIFFLGKNLKPCLVLGYHVFLRPFYYAGMKAYHEQSFILLANSEFT